MTCGCFPYGIKYILSKHFKCRMSLDLCWYITICHKRKVQDEESNKLCEVPLLKLAWVLYLSTRWGCSISHLPNWLLFLPFLSTFPKKCHMRPIFYVAQLNVLKIFSVLCQIILWQKTFAFWWLFCMTVQLNGGQSMCESSSRVYCNLRFARTPNSYSAGLSALDLLGSHWPRHIVN